MTMKKLTLILCLGLALNLMACSDDDNDKNEKTGTTTGDSTQTDDQKSTNDSQQQTNPNQNDPQQKAGDDQTTPEKQPECTNNARECKDGIPRLCNNGHWQALSACESNETCENGECKKKAEEQPSGPKSTQSDLDCTGKADNGFCTTVNGETWAYYCTGGEVLVVEEDWQGNCTQKGMECIFQAGDEEVMSLAWCGCSKDSDCPSDFPYCDKQEQQCIQCKSNNDCKGDTPYCDTDYYFQCVACTENKHCSGSTPACHPYLLECVECMEDNDCKDGKTCDVTFTGAKCI